MNRAVFRDDPEHPRCVGSDCLRRHLDVLEARATDDVRRSVEFLRRGGRP